MPMTRQQAIDEVLADRTAAKDRVVAAAHDLEHVGDDLFDSLFATVIYDDAVAELAAINQDPIGMVDLVETFGNL